MGGRFGEKEHNSIAVLIPAQLFEILNKASSLLHRKKKILIKL